ncbi:MAG: GGDEF domain-containing protein [Moorellaceae bacterium]
MINPFELPPLMGVVDTLEFLLPRVAAHLGTEMVGFRRGSTVYTYDRDRGMSVGDVPYGNARPDAGTEWGMVYPIDDGWEMWLPKSSKPLLSPDVVQSLAAFCSRILDNARKYEEAMQSASTDILTGLLNRKAIVQKIEEEILRGSRYRTKFCLVFLDLDGFKRVNDVLGHAAGDRLLRGVASVITRSIRKSDAAARFGGDEFIILLKEISVKQAETVCCRIKAGVARMDTGLGSGVSASVGISSYPEDGKSAEELINIADSRMYAEKSKRKAGLC